VQSKRKGLSLEDKRDAMQTIFSESRDVYMIKDVEKLSMKKGIIQQAVKDVLQVGTTTYVRRDVRASHADAASCRAARRMRHSLSLCSQQAGSPHPTSPPPTPTDPPCALPLAEPGGRRPCDL
jgi:hypothetical protein